MGVVRELFEAFACARCGGYAVELYNGAVARGNEIRGQVGALTLISIIMGIIGCGEYRTHSLQTLSRHCFNSILIVPTAFSYLTNLAEFVSLVGDFRSRRHIDLP